MRLLRLEFKSNNTIKSKAIKCIAKNVCIAIKYCVKRIEQNRLILISNCGVCGKKKSRITKNQEVH